MNKNKSNKFDRFLQRIEILIYRLKHGKSETGGYNVSIKPLKAFWERYVRNRIFIKT